MTNKDNAVISNKKAVCSKIGILLENIPSASD